MTRLDRRTARVSTGAIAYVDEGDGAPVVLMHGFPTNADLWRNLGPLLAPRFRVIAPDLLGYGHSDKPFGADLTETSQAGYVGELLKQLELNEFAVVGHGLGGAIGQLLALAGGVKTLVLMNSPTLGTSNPGPQEAVRSADPGALAEALADRTVREAFARGMGHPERMTQADVELFARPWRVDPPALVRAAKASIPARQGEHRDAGDRLRTLDMPAFLVWGEDDPWFPVSSAERLQDLLPDAALAVLPGCSHFVLEDALETVGPMVFEFLRLRYLGESHAHAPERVVAPVDLGVSLDPPAPLSGLPDEEN